MTLRIFSILFSTIIFLKHFPFSCLEGLKIAFNTGLLKLLINENIDPLISKPSLKSDKNLTKLKNLRSRLGIAAGLDKNGEYIDCLAALGIGFIEVGTVTPNPREGMTNREYFEILKTNLF